MKLAPSIYTADFANLGQHVRDAEAAGVDVMHLDIMDGHFVPNITFGPAVCAAVARSTSLLCEAHLMVEQPERFFEDYKKAGVKRIIVHVETCPHLYRTIQQLREMNLQVGVTLNPLTPINIVENALPLVDLVLVMSVEPGYGGQAYIKQATARIRSLRNLMDAIGSKAELEVDGGINAQTIREVQEAGASMVVVGSAIYNDKHGVADGVKLLRKALGEV